MAALVVMALLAGIWFGRAVTPRVPPTAGAAASRQVPDESPSDPDLAPFIAHTPHPGAKSHFLLGVRYSYLHEKGSEGEMLKAIELDPNFVAPHVWRVGGILERSDPKEIRAYRATLARLDGIASVFEKGLINWVEAALDGDGPGQRRALKVVLDEAPGNRIVTSILAAVELALGNPEQCWQRLERLLEERWDYPGFYPTAVDCALARGELPDVERTLSAAVELDSVDPEIYDSLHKIAIYRDDPVAEKRWSRDLESRILEIAPESYEPAVEPLVEFLAARAETEGKSGIERRLREFLD